MTESTYDDDLIVFTVEEPSRLDAFLARHILDVSRSKIAQWIEQGHCRVDGRLESKSSAKLRVGQTVELDDIVDTEIHDLTPADIPLDVRYEDDDVLVVNKPRGLAAHPAASLKEPSLVNALLSRGGVLSSHGGAFRPGIVHRLDKDTTGLMVIAKNDASHANLAKQFESKTAERRYVGIIAGLPAQDRFDINAPIARDKRDRQKMTVDPEGKSALTHCRVLERMAQTCLMAFRLSTGRTHQIRVHVRAIGHPILGDTIYGTKDYSNGPLQLHAAFLAFDHPKTGIRVETFVGPPNDFGSTREIHESELQNF